MDSLLLVVEHSSTSLSFPIPFAAHCSGIIEWPICLDLLPNLFSHAVLWLPAGVLWISHTLWIFLNVFPRVFLEISPGSVLTWNPLLIYVLSGVIYQQF